VVKLPATQSEETVVVFHQGKKQKEDLPRRPGRGAKLKKIGGLWSRLRGVNSNRAACKLKK